MASRKTKVTHKVLVPRGRGGAGDDIEAQAAEAMRAQGTKPGRVYPVTSKQAGKQEFSVTSRANVKEGSIKANVGPGGTVVYTAEPKEERPPKYRRRR